MATWYVDLIGGNDANAGTSYATRWKTFAGTGSASIAAGDTVKVMATPDYTDMGQAATWTQYSRTVTLTSAVTTNIALCDSAWTASSNVTTASNTTAYKQGTASSKFTVATAFTTGKAAYFATGTLNLSGYQQISFWIRNDTAIAASALQIKLCSDTAGATAVNTFTLPAIPSVNQWVPMTLNSGGALGSSIASIALYVATDLSTGANVVISLDNILAVKAVSSVDSLSLTSLISKEWSQYWSGSKSYLTNDCVRPTSANRTGYIYKTTGGTSGSSEPTWPAYIGGTVTDNGMTWTCVDNEEAWFPIASINGTSIAMDQSVNTLAGYSNVNGYQRATETVNILKREPSNIPTMITSSTTDYLLISKGGTISSYVTYSGGWNTTDMTTQTGETWISGQNGLGLLLHVGANYVTSQNLSFTRGTKGVVIDTNGVNIKFTHVCGNTSYGFDLGNNYTGTGPITLIGCNSNSNSATGIYSTASYWNKYVAVESNSNDSEGINSNTNQCFATDTKTINNAAYGFKCGYATLNNFTGSNNGAGVDLYLRHFIYLYGSTPGVYQVNDEYCDIYAYSHNHNGTVGSYEFGTDGGKIVSDTTTRHTAFGNSWKFTTSGASDGRRGAAYPFQLSIAKVGCTSGVPINMTIWCYADNASMVGRLFIPGCQVTGVPTDTYLTCTPASLNTWTQSSTLTVTPTANGVIEVFFQAWDTSAPSTSSFWIDDLTFS